MVRVVYHTRELRIHLGFSNLVSAQQSALTVVELCRHLVVVLHRHNRKHNAGAILTRRSARPQMSGVQSSLHPR